VVVVVGAIGGGSVVVGGGNVVTGATARPTVIVIAVPGSTCEPAAKL
jgi:hypothetical protein